MLEIRRGSQKLEEEGSCEVRRGGHLDRLYFPVSAEYLLVMKFPNQNRL